MLVIDLAHSLPQGKPFTQDLPCSNSSRQCSSPTPKKPIAQASPQAHGRITVSMPSETSWRRCCWVWRAADFLALCALDCDGLLWGLGREDVLSDLQTFPPSAVARNGFDLLGVIRSLRSTVGLSLLGCSKWHQWGLRRRIQRIAPYVEDETNGL